MASMTSTYADFATVSVARARSIIWGLSLWQLRAAEVYTCDLPDITNPSGYYDRWVILKYRSCLGFMRRKVLYFEPTAYDESRQEHVEQYARRLLAAINAE